MTGKGNTLHFINRLDESNCGDRVTCPLLHYYDYFKQYQIMRHDMRFIEYDSIADTDVVIIGGGGMFDYAEFTNRAINRVLDTGAAVVAWSPGFNTHKEYSGTFGSKILFDRFAIAAVRDFHNSYGLEYLPDVTCKLSGLERKYALKREYGIARHKDYPIQGLSFDTITNDQSLEDILQFIGETEIVISNSFHMIYWSLLMGKRTLCAAPFSTRFYSYKYKPEYFNPQMDSLADHVKQAHSYQILDECRSDTDRFFERVRQLIEGRLEPARNYWRGYDLVTKDALCREKLRESYLQTGDLLASQLFIDTGEGFTEECKLISINNVYGDDKSTVRFDLSGFSDIRALRFDPIESHNCKVEILSAKTKTGDAILTAQAAVRSGVWDRFLCTDPQYRVLTHCSEFLEIVFRLRTMTLFESEQNIYGYAERQEQSTHLLERQLEEKRQQITDQAAQLKQRETWVDELTTHVGQQDARINSVLEALSAREKETNRLTESLSACENQVSRLTKSLSEYECEVNRLTESLSAQGEEVRCLTESLSARKEDVNCLTARLEIQNAQLTDLTEQLQQETCRAASHAEEVQRIYASKSWRLTAPLRAIARFFKTLVKGDREHGTN